MEVIFSLAQRTRPMFIVVVVPWALYEPRTNIQNRTHIFEDKENNKTKI